MKLRIRSKIALRPIFGLGVCVLLVACGGSKDPDSTDGGKVFIAVTGDFADFRSWESFDGGSNVLDNVVPTDTPRTIYMNERPAAGSTAFPVGTIIVKTVDGGQTFAMVKRGGGFNYTGAKDWEWFELADSAEGKPVIIWRGAAPPANQSYGGVPTAACNVCHAQDIKNDFVRDGSLRLSNF